VRAVELQRRGCLHWHVIVAYSTLSEKRAADLYVEELVARAPAAGLGFVDRKKQLLERTAAAAYLSSYFVAGKKGKMTLTESVQSGQLPRSIVYVSPTLSKLSGVTMRSLRLKRYAWHVWRKVVGSVGCTAMEVDQVWFGLNEGWALARICHEFL